MELPTFENIMKPTSTNMRLLGIPLEDGCRVTPKFFLYFINLQFVVVEEFVFIINRMGPDHFLELTALAPCLAIGVLGQYKGLAIFLNRKKIAKILNDVKILYDEIIEEDLKITGVEKNLKFVITLSKYFFILNQAVIWVYIFIPLVLMGVEYGSVRSVAKLLLPYDVAVPFSCDTWKPWLGVYFHSIIAAVTTVVYVVAADTLYFVLTNHVCINFGVISHKLERLSPANSADLTHIVKRHQYLIELSRDLEEIFAPTLLLNFVASCIEICMLGFNVVAGDAAHLPSFLVFLTSALAQIFLLSLFGNLLITESERVGQAAYLCGWPDMDRRTRSSLIVLRERARRPLQLTAMKFTPISYASFSKIISTSWSYFTLLNTVYSPPGDD